MSDTGRLGSVDHGNQLGRRFRVKRWCHKDESFHPLKGWAVGCGFLIGKPQRVLTQTLRGLERDGYVIRTVHPSSPLTVEYRLTKMGESLLKPMSGLVAWANQHFDQVVDSRKRYDVRAGTLAK